MKEIKLSAEELKKIIEESLPKLLREKFSSSYDNPIRKVLDEELTSQSGAIRGYVKTIIASVFADEAIRKRIADEVIAQLIQEGFKG